MKKTIAKFLKWVSLKFNGLSVRVDPLIPEKTEWEKVIDKWGADRGEWTLRMEYPLKEDAVVWDVGGFEGQWASDMYARYTCNFYIFEPIKSYADAIAKRFRTNNKMHSYAYGLGAENRTMRISHLENSSSVFKESEEMEEIQLKKASEVMKKLKAEKIDLMKINIEGGEYELLEDLIESGEVKKIKNIQVQFHTFVENAEARRKAIRKELKKTHQETYCYPFVWENWERKAGK